MPSKPSASIRTPSSKATKKPKPALRSVPPNSRESEQRLERIAREREAPGSVAPARARGVVEMPGRLLADGSRRGAKTARRLTVYLPLEVATELGVRAAREGKTLSDIASTALAQALGVELGNDRG